MPRQRTSRLYKRNGRFYADFRDLGGGRERLVPSGEKLATTDVDVANKLCAARVKELERAKRDRHLLNVKRTDTLGHYAAEHLRLKEREPKKKGTQPVTTVWLSQVEKHLQSAIDFFGPDRNLAAIDTDDVDAWVEHLRQQDSGRGGTLSEGTVRSYLNSFSNLLDRAKSKGYVDKNAVADLYVKPVADDTEAEHLAPEEAALLLESARTYRPPTGLVRQGHGGAISPHGYPYMYPLLATYLLTGARKSEILGLEVDDVSLRHNKIYIRPNGWRRLKNKGSKRTIPLWPQLKEILTAYMAERERSGGIGTLLFPSGRGMDESMIRDLRKALNTIGTRAGFPEAYIKLHMLRHTYTAARIQTCDRGRPVALYTVARELGHSSPDQIEDRYGHLHDRAEEGGVEVVEFRVDHFRDKLADRLNALQPIE